MAPLRTFGHVRHVTPMLLVTSVLALTACAGSTVESASSDAITTTAPTSEVETAATDAAIDAAAAVPEALQFTATLVGGEPFDAATLAGRPVAMWFWAPG